MIQNELEDNLTREEKIQLFHQFYDLYPKCTVQDIYKWLYSGEFGDVAKNRFFRKERIEITPLQSILDDLKKDESLENRPRVVWEPMGFSNRFLKIFLINYNEKEYPLKRLVDFVERSPAFQGHRMRFKLDWILIKDYCGDSDEVPFNREDFLNLEERILFHQLPDISYSGEFSSEYPFTFRIVPQKLFFEYFPEFYQNPRGVSISHDM